MSIQDFNYLNNNDSSAVIDKTQAQDLLNVDITPSGHSIKKRKGYGLYKTLTGSAAIHGGHHFFDSSGNDVQIWGSSTSLWGIVADATATQLVSSATLASTWQCTDIAAFAYCVNSSRDALIKTNGATMTWLSLPASNIGTMIISTPDRLVTAGSSANPNVIYFSGSTSYTNFTSGILATDPFSELIAAPGSKITHIKYAFGRILWWKDQSFGYILGTDQTNMQIVTVSNVIGTFDNTDAFYDNVVYFRGQDGQIYQYDGASMTLLSREISATTSVSNRRKSNFWAISTTSDFATGSFSTTTYNATASGVIISTNNLNFTDNSFETSGGWVAGALGGFDQTGVGFMIGDNCGIINPKSGSKLRRGSNNTAWSLVATVLDAVTGASYGSTSVAYASNSCTWTQRTISISAPIKTQVKVRLSGALNSDILTTNSFAFSGTNITFWTASDSESSGASRTIDIDFFENGVTTNTVGVYYSAVHNAPNVSTWDTFSATKADGNGTHSFLVRSSTNIFTTLSSTPTWVAQTVGAVVAASTGTYFQMADTFTVTAASQTPTLNNFQFNWFEGSAADQSYATYFADAIWFSVSNGAAATTNNAILRYDLLNKGWGIYDITANGFLVQNNVLYFGDPAASGKLYKFGTGTSDNGTAISAYWKSKDFVGPDVFLENEIQTINVATKTQANETLTVTYTLNTSTSTSYNISLTNATDTLIRNKKLIPPGKMGGFFNIKFSDSSTGSQWEVFGIKIDLKPLTYRPS